MWISEQLAGQRQNNTAEFGTTRLSQTAASVYTKGERRELPVYAPTGLAWRPREGDTVLVIKDTDSGQPCVAGAKQTDPPVLRPGEICLYCGGAAIHLRSDGVIALTGTVEINGEEYRSGEENG